MTFTLSDHPYTAAIFGKTWANRLATKQLSIENIETMYEFFKDDQNNSLKIERIGALIADKSIGNDAKDYLKKFNKVILAKNQTKIGILQFWVFELGTMLKADEAILYHFIEQCLAYEACMRLNSATGTDFIRAALSPAAILMRLMVSDILHPGSSSQLKNIFAGKPASKEKTALNSQITATLINQIPDRLISIYNQYAVLGMRKKTESEQKMNGYAQGALNYFLTFVVLGFYVDFWIAREVDDEKKSEANRKVSAMQKEVIKDSHPVMQALVERFKGEEQHLNKFCIVDALMMLGLPDAEILRIYQMLDNKADLLPGTEREIEALYQGLSHLSLGDLDDLYHVLTTGVEGVAPQKKLAEDIRVLRDILSYKMLIEFGHTASSLQKLKHSIDLFLGTRKISPIQTPDMPTAQNKKGIENLDQIISLIRNDFKVTNGHTKLVESILAPISNSFDRATLRRQFKELMDLTQSVGKSMPRLHNQDNLSPMRSTLKTGSTGAFQSPVFNADEISIDELLAPQSAQSVSRRSSFDSTSARSSLSMLRAPKNLGLFGRSQSDESMRTPDFSASQPSEEEEVMPVSLGRAPSVAHWKPKREPATRRNSLVAERVTIQSTFIS